LYTPEHLIKPPNPLLERYRKRYALGKDLALIPYKRLPLNSWINLATLMLIIWVGLLLTRGLIICAVVNHGPLSKLAPEVGATVEDVRHWFDNGSALPPAIAAKLSQLLGQNS
jgi:hypothetical protein